LGGEIESSPAPSSFFARVTGAFASPTQTFEDAARRPRFFAPFLATLIFFAGFWGVVCLKLGLTGMAVAVMQYFRRETLVTQDEIDFALQWSRALAPAVLIGGAIAILAHLLVIAWVGARLANLFFGARMRLRAALSVACHAYLAKAIAQTILGIPMVLFGDVKGLNFGNLLPTNFAFFLDPKDVSRILYALLQSLDLIQLWYFALLGIGLSTDSDDPSSPVAMGAILVALWMGWNVFLASFRALAMGG
jgi:Yip1 domain